jgi:hypothetical protein
LGHASVDSLKVEPTIKSLLGQLPNEMFFDLSDYSRYATLDTNASFDIALGLNDGRQAKRLFYDVGKPAKSVVLNTPTYQLTSFFKESVTKQSDGLDHLGRPLQ